MSNLYGPSTTAPARANGFAIAGIVLGIVGVFFAEVVLGPLAIIFGGVGVSKANRDAGHRGTAWAGVVLGIVDVLIFAVLIILAANNHGHFYWHVG